MSYENILTETRGEGARQTGLITLNRPKQLNALNDGLMDDLGAALKAFDADPGIGCIVITCSE
jgi:enoyl-CoA hydratase